MYKVKVVDWVRPHVSYIIHFEHAIGWHEVGLDGRKINAENCRRRILVCKIYSPDSSAASYIQGPLWR